MPELVNNKCAFIVEKNDVIGLKNAIEELLIDDKKRKIMSNNAIEQVHKFDKTRYCKNFYDLIKNSLR